MSKRQNYLVLSLLICGICGLLTISGRAACVGGGKSKAKTGSSTGNTFIINAPSNLSATAVFTSQINLSWQDNSNNEDGFELERSTDGINYSLLSTFNANATSYSDSGLRPFVAYYYRIRAFNTIGDRSEWSNILTAATLIPVWSIIDAGAAHNTVLTAGGTIYTWGFNDQGQLGLGDNNGRNIPFLVESDVSLNVFDNISSTVAGYNHTIVLKRDGTIWTCGLNDSGQLGLGDTESANIPFPIAGGNSDWSKIAAGYFNSFGIKTNGILWAWGDNFYGQLGIGGTWTYNEGGGYWYVVPTNIYTPIQIGTDSDWFTLTGAFDHTIGLKTNGTLWAWGYNEGGQLGMGDYLNRTTITQIGSDSDWLVDSYTGTNSSTIATGMWYSLAIKTDRTLWAWGSNWDGQLGTGDLEIRLTPSSVGTTSDWSIVVAGSTHNIAIKTDGTLWTWGSDYFGSGQLGRSGNTTIPGQVGIDSDWLLAAAGQGNDNRILSQYSIGLKNDGTLWAWGDNVFGQLGLGDSGWNTNRITPTNISITAPPRVPTSLIAINILVSQTNISWIDISNNETGFKIERKTGRNGIYVQIALLGPDINSYSDISASGFAPLTYYCYRIKAYNVYGDSSYSNESWAAISGNWLNIAAGFSHSIGLKSDMTLWTWGYNNHGQLGLGDTISRTTPSVLSGSDWSLIAGGTLHTIALKNDSTLWGWGYNYNGQLGDNTTTTRTTPRQVFGSTSDWSVIAAGISHTVALKTDSTLWAWGYNYYGQLGINSTTQKTIPTKEFTSASDWSKISSGGHYTLALKTDNTLWAWGYNYSGQLGTGDTNQRTTPTQVYGAASDWSTIATGRGNTHSHSLAIKTNETIWVWGANQSGQLGLGDTGYATKRTTPTQIGADSDWFKIIAGENHTIALKTNNILLVWGNNNYGQLGLGDNTDRNTPTQVNTDSGWFAIAGGGNHSLGLKTNGIIWMWGSNNYGQLGLGDTINWNVPALVGE